MPGYPLQPQAERLAQAGRYGDSMLMHVNPAEVAGLASIMPITRNPETGQPEAYAFLLPMLASMFSTTALPAALASIGGAGSTLAGAGAWLGAPSGIAGALGGGLAEWASTGDFKQGLMSGLTGYGIGKGLGQLGKAATKDALAQTVQSQIGDQVAAGTADSLVSDALKTAATGDGINAQAIPGIAGSPGARTPLAENFGWQVNPKGSASGLPWSDAKQVALASQGVSPSAQVNLANSLTDAARSGFQATGQNWGAEGLREGLRNPGDLLAQMQTPQAMMPLMGGMSGQASAESLRLWEEQVARQRQEEEEQRRRYAAESPELVPLSNIYSRRYGPQGGIVG